MKNKIDKGSILFILYALWHSVIVSAFVESSESVFLGLVLSIGIIGIDIYLFFSNHARNKEKEKLSELIYNYQQLKKEYEEAIKREERSKEFYLQLLDTTPENNNTEVNDEL